MAPAFSKEAILMGAVDYLCLVCESYLKNDREVAAHVTEPAHSDNMSKTSFVDKYRSDRIRKIKKWYFCELCNILLSTLPKVDLHVEEPMHNESKLSQIVKRVGNFVIVNEIAAINEEAWHGLVEDTCTLCNVEFEDKNVHKSETVHVINLIQSKVVDVGGNIYRKFEYSSFHCLTCNKVVAAITSHLNEIKHKKILEKCRQIMSLKQEEHSAIKFVSEPINEKVVNSENKEEANNTQHSHNITHKTIIDKNKIGNDKIPTALKEERDENIDVHTCEGLQANEYIIQAPGDKKYCILCDWTIESNEAESHVNDKHHETILLNADVVELTPPLLFNKDNKHKTIDGGTLFTSPVLVKRCEVENEKNEETKTNEHSKVADTDTIQQLAQKHGLKYNCSDKNVYCPKCNKNIPSTVANINEHVQGTLHRNVAPKSNNTKRHDDTVKIKAKNCDLPRVPICQFVRNITDFNNGIVHDVVINEKYCINYFSFICVLAINNQRFRCHLCDITMYSLDIQIHVFVRHSKLMTDSPVIIYPDTSEFIREIRSGAFHCGFCNIVATPWQEMENHLKCAEHKECKTFANFRLQFLPEAARHPEQQSVYTDILKHLNK